MHGTEGDVANRHGIQAPRESGIAMLVLAAQAHKPQKPVSLNHAISSGGPEQIESSQDSQKPLTTTGMPASEGSRAVHALMHRFSTVNDWLPLGIICTADASTNVSRGGNRLLHFRVHEGTTVKQHDSTISERSECLGAISGDGRLEDGIVRQLRNLMIRKSMPLVKQRGIWLLGCLSRPRDILVMQRRSLPTGDAEGILDL